MVCTENVYESRHLNEIIWGELIIWGSKCLRGLLIKRGGPPAD